MRMFNNVPEEVVNPIKKEMEGISFWPTLVVLLWTWSSRNCHFGTNNGKELFTGSNLWCDFHTEFCENQSDGSELWDGTQTMCLHCLMQSLIPPHTYKNSLYYWRQYPRAIKYCTQHTSTVSIVKHRLLYAIKHHQNYIDSACFFQTDILPDWTEVWRNFYCWVGSTRQQW